MAISPPTSSIAKPVCMTVVAVAEYAKKEKNQCQRSREAAQGEQHKYGERKTGDDEKI